MFGELTKPLTFDFQSYINELQANPWQYFTLALDIVIVCFYYMNLLSLLKITSMAIIKRNSLVNSNYYIK